MSKAVIGRIKRFNFLNKKLQNERESLNIIFKAYILEIYKHIDEIGSFEFETPWRGDTYKVNISSDKLIKYNSLGEVVDRVDIKDESDLFNYLEKISRDFLSIYRLEMTMESIGNWLDRYISKASVERRANELMKR